MSKTVILRSVLILLLLAGVMFIGKPIFVQALSEQTAAPVAQAQNPPPAPLPKPNPSIPQPSTTGQPSKPISSAPLPQAPVVFDPPLVDLGVVRPNQRVRGQVMMRNAGTVPLTILDSRATCTCTSVALKNVVLAPGEEVAVPVRFNGQGNIGIKPLSIKFAISGYEMAQVAVRVKIESPIVVEPSAISALKVNDIPVTDGQFVIRSVESKPFRVLAVNGEPPSFVDFNPSADEPRPLYRIRWSVASFDPVTCVNGLGQRMPGWFLVETDHPEVPLIDLEVRHECNSRAKAGLPAEGQNWLTDQKAVMIGELKAGQSTEFDLGINHLDRRFPLDDKVNAVRSESPNIDVELLNVREEGGNIELQVKVTAKGDHRGALYAPIRFYSPRFDCPLVVMGKIVD